MRASSRRSTHTTSSLSPLILAAASVEELSHLITSRAPTLAQDRSISRAAVRAVVSSVRPRICSPQGKNCRSAIAYSRRVGQENTSRSDANFMSGIGFANTYQILFERGGERSKVRSNSEPFMHHVTLIGNSRADLKALRRQFAGVLDIDFEPLDQALRSNPGPRSYLIFVSTMRRSTPHLGQSRVAVEREGMARAEAKERKGNISDRQASLLQRTRAHAHGATDVLHPPVIGRELLATLWGDVTSLSADPTNTKIRKSFAVSAAVDTLQNIFASACLGGQLDCPSVKSTGDEIVSHLETQGLAAWTETVRTHHSMTYQHCLLVTGLAVAFGQQIGVSRADRQRLSFAGMLHDIGKARFRSPFSKSPVVWTTTR